MDIETSYYSSPVGLLRLRATVSYLCELHFCDAEETAAADLQQPLRNPILLETVNQLMAYFSGQRRVFDIPVAQSGTPFQQSVWSALLDIPFGKTISYLDLAKKLGDPKCIRAAANTNGKNNIAIIVPCHRVIGSNGSLVGFAGGIPKKKWLLAHERKWALGVQTLF
ncbi:MAG TPA: methylated-DNA--[protein]-cysteine S-methyltransferase [Flavihumibacter sp.]|nr:methylated-DNA--[protein]-cysteine S-methyltransferase [Bacteroidota bacterium]HPZ88085.1 methylated-DNA--[protein]-cysteine S-methyltransferase [Flavihumibacter sp.]